MGLGTLEEETFFHCCHLFLQQSEQLGDGWSWESVQGSQEGYLRKAAVKSAVINSNPLWDQEQSQSNSKAWSDQQEQEQSGLIDEDDGDCMVPAGNSQVLQYEYHILYSCSYNTPVLYFRVSTLGITMIAAAIKCQQVPEFCRVGTHGNARVYLNIMLLYKCHRVIQNGRSLSLEEVWSSVHPNLKVKIHNSPLNTITQQEHPLLGQPFFMLHPCRTQEFMRPVLQAAQEQCRPVNYVLMWLSVVGPLVGLDVPLKYSTQLHTATEPD